MADEKKGKSLSDSELLARIEQLERTEKEMIAHGMIGDSAELLNLRKEKEKRQRSDSGD